MMLFFFKKMSDMCLVGSRSGLSYTVSFVKRTASSGGAFSGKRDNGSVSQFRKQLLGNIFSVGHESVRPDG